MAGGCSRRATDASAPAAHSEQGGRRRHARAIAGGRSWRAQPQRSRAQAHARRGEGGERRAAHQRSEAEHADLELAQEALALVELGVAGVVALLELVKQPQRSGEAHGQRTGRRLGGKQRVGAGFAVGKRREIDSEA